jgi:hypothetical protein
MQDIKNLIDFGALVRSRVSDLAENEKITAQILDEEPDSAYGVLLRALDRVIDSLVDQGEKVPRKESQVAYELFLALHHFQNDHDTKRGEALMQGMEEMVVSTEQELLLMAMKSVLVPNRKAKMPPPGNPKETKPEPATKNPFADFFGNHKKGQPQVESAFGADPTPKHGEKGIVVCPHIPHDPDERRLDLQYAALTKPVRIKRPRNPAGAFAQLRHEMPWADSVIDTLERELARRAMMAESDESSPALPSILLYGRPGCGKSYLVSRLCELLDVHHRVIPMGGENSSATMTGADRVYGTAKPGAAIDVIVEGGVANPALILDELDKVTEPGRNGDPVAALLAMMEPRTAKALHDRALNARTDVSLVSFLATANSIAHLSHPLISRFKLVRELPTPNIEQRIGVAKRLWKAEMEKYGITPITPGFCYPGQEMDRAIREANASVRTITKVVERSVGVVIESHMRFAH